MVKIDYFTIGLLFIVIGWLVQLLQVLTSKNREINPYFLVLYIIGVLLLVIGNYLVGNISSTLFNLVSAILPLVILVVLLKR